MKILFVHNAYQNFGGEDAVVCAEIALLQSHGHDVELYKRHNDDLHQLAAASAAITAIWSQRSVDEINAVCNRLQPDVIHVHNTFPLISPSIYWAATRNKIPVIQTLHNFRFLCPQGTFLRDGTICEDCLGKSPWRAVIRKCYRGSFPQSAVLVSMLGAHRASGTYRDKVTRYITLSTFSRDRFIKGGLPESRIRVKPNFVESAFEPDWNNRHGGLFVGRLSDEKGIDTLLDAARNGNNANIEVIGGGPRESAVAECFEERYLGFLSRDTIINKMRSAAYLIVPSVCYEQLPTTILEAFSSGLPVIASRLGALIDIVQDGVTGLLFDPGNGADLAAKIAWANAHPEAMQEMGRAARAEYEAKYTPSINYQMLMEIYENAIAAVHRERHAA
jgi:glycosyltransferase involved in cell wall biosynthesis